MLGPNVTANVKEGLSYSLSDYARAAATQTRIYRSYQSFFATHDVLISPTITLSPRPWSEPHRPTSTACRPAPISTGSRWPMR